jgi:hypothetical protein
MTRSLVAAFLLVVLAAPAAAAQLDELLRGLPSVPGLPSSGQPSDTRIADGLKEALRVGTANAVDLTGRVDGYFANQAIRILMPERLRTLERALRAVGYGPQVDELVLGMNRAAERAAPAARSIFWDAITAMTFDDARRILDGGETAATEFFRTRTTDRLTAAFRPVVEQSMDEVGVSRQYKTLLEQARAIPFLKTEDYDLDRYVVGKALDGLFHVVGDEELKIRANPAARTTELLREVFGRR